MDNVEELLRLVLDACGDQGDSLIVDSPLGPLQFCLRRDDERKRVLERFRHARSVSTVQAGIAQRVTAISDSKLSQLLLDAIKSSSSNALWNAVGQRYHLTVVDDRMPLEPVDVFWDSAEDPRYPSALVINAPARNQTITFSDYNHPLSAHIPIRTMRYLLTANLVSAGGIYLHGAIAQTKQGIGVLLVGDKFAGKTTMLMGLLKSGLFNLVCNDKSVELCKYSHGKPFAIGIPCSIPLWENTMRLFPELAINADETTSGWYTNNSQVSKGASMRKFFLQPDRVADAFGCQTRQASSIDLVLNLCFNESETAAPRVVGTEINRVAASAVLDSISNTPNNRYWDYISGLAELTKTHLVTQFEERFHQLPVFNLHYGPRQDRDVCLLIMKVCQTLSGPEN